MPIKHKLTGIGVSIMSTAALFSPSRTCRLHTPARPAVDFSTHNPCDGDRCEGFSSMPPAQELTQCAGIVFPTTESLLRPVQPMPQIRPPHLPFRRISLPTAPSLVHRQSVVSVASFDSLQEDEQRPVLNPSLVNVSNVYNASRYANPPPRRSKAHPPPSYIESPRKGRRRDSVKPHDHSRSKKRRNIIEEFLETEKSYVDGLDLIYTVCH